MRPLVSKLLLMALPLMFLGCYGSEAPPDVSDDNAALAPSAAPPAAPGPSAAGVPAPVTSRTPAAGSAITAPGATFMLPETWVSQAPSSSMRLAQAQIPGAAGDGQLTVFYFGPGGGGGVDANIDRWVGQMEVAAGVSPQRETFENGPFKVTWIDVEGTLKPSTMGVGPSVAQPGSRLLGAVIEGAQGPWFFKATGPTETLASEREAFLFMLRSATAP